MATHKRKTLQIKRPEATSFKPGKKLPKVDVNEDAAAGKSPKTAQIKKPDVNAAPGSKPEEATRIQLPSEAKIRKARRADESQVLPDESLPQAEQIAQAEKSATMPIQIDTEEVQSVDPARLAQAQDQGNDQTMQINTDELEGNDRTMQIDPAALEEEVDNVDQTMEIDPVAAEVVGNDQTMKLNADELEGSDQTMQIDPAALVTGDISAAVENDDPNMTMEVDAAALAAEAPEESPAVDAGDPNMTMEVDAAALAAAAPEPAIDPAELNQTMELSVDDVTSAEEQAAASQKIEEQIEEKPTVDPQSMETMVMEPFEDKASPLSRDEIESSLNAQTMDMADAAAEADDRDQTIDLQNPANIEQASDDGVTKETMEMSFNSMTMAMDTTELSAAVGEAELKAADDELGSDSVDQTIDLTEQRPKTVMIKRPSREAGSAPQAPTVKTVRPDAVTVRTNRPVTAQPAAAKEGTSRIDVPEGAGGNSQEGKTIKLRRPAGAGPRPGAPVSGVASRAGLQMNSDGSVHSTAPVKQSLGATWLVFGILTFLVAAGGLWVVSSVNQVEMPMYGRVVDVNGTIIPPSP